MPGNVSVSGLIGTRSRSASQSSSAAIVRWVLSSIYVRLICPGAGRPQFSRGPGREEWLFPAERDVPVIGTLPLMPSPSPLGWRNLPTAWRRPVPESAVSGNSAPGIPNYQWDEIFDVVVVGSGGGALPAAMAAARGGASTGVVEKDQFIGGTTAVSGGDMWIPNNRFVKDRDSRADAIAYLTRLSDGRAADPGLIEVYVDSAPEAFEYLLETTGYDSEPHLTLNDYYSVIGDRIPGVRHFPRTCAVKPYPAGLELGLELARKINRGPWIAPAEVSFPEQRRGEVGPEELAKREREVWGA